MKKKVIADQWGLVIFIATIEYKINDNRNKTLSVGKYLNRIRPYLEDAVNNLKKSDTMQIQLTIAINFKSSKDTDEVIELLYNYEIMKKWEKIQKE